MPGRGHNRIVRFIGEEMQGAFQMAMLIFFSAFGEALSLILGLACTSLCFVIMWGYRVFWRWVSWGSTGAADVPAACSFPSSLATQEICEKKISAEAC
eukprot:903335-Pelagomonas_calceolata.AAC.1